MLNEFMKIRSLNLVIVVILKITAHKGNEENLPNGWNLATQVKLQMENRVTPEEVKVDKDNHIKKATHEVGHIFPQQNASW